MKKISPMLRNARFWLAEEWKWYRKHGASLTAYVQRYGHRTDPNKHGEGGELIHSADLKELHRKFERVRKHALGLHDFAARGRWVPKRIPPGLCAALLLSLLVFGCENTAGFVNVYGIGESGAGSVSVAWDNLACSCQQFFSLFASFGWFHVLYWLGGA